MFPKPITKFNNNLTIFFSLVLDFDPHFPRKNSQNYNKYKNLIYDSLSLKNNFPIGSIIPALCKTTNIQNFAVVSLVSNTVYPKIWSGKKPD